jgi:2-dehydro-3-deoxyphosphogluconate aldolase/(4S)-4-hydroxy-2-oxoglutarate aldolase
MSRLQTLARIVATGIIPVVRVPSPALALRAVGALRSGGLDVVEVTMTVPGAIDLIEQLAVRFDGELVVGAGTVVDAATARACISAGAAFVVSPILDEDVITCCRTHGVPVLPGALTPTEVMRAWRAGAEMVKVFPCGAVGGAAYVRALKAPLPQIDLVPTGGVTAKTVSDFIAAGASAVGAGADLIDVARLANGEEGPVIEQARRYVEAVRAARRG